MNNLSLHVPAVGISSVKGRGVWFKMVIGVGEVVTCLIIWNETSFLVRSYVTRFNAAIEITYKCRGIIGEEETIFLPFYIFFRFFFFFHPRLRSCDIVFPIKQFATRDKFVSIPIRLKIIHANDSSEKNYDILTFREGMPKVLY